MKSKLVLGLLTALAWLPMWALYGISDAAYLLVYYVVRYRRKVVSANLHRVYPQKSEAEIRHITRKFYRHLCDIVVETVKLLHVSDEEMARRVEVHGTELIHEAYNEGHSVVSMLGHYGNWEWVTAASTHFPPQMIACQIYHPLRSQTMDAVMLKLRDRFHSVSIPMKQAVRTLLGYERDGRRFNCGFIADQHPSTRHAKHWAPFMGIETDYMVGGEQIGNHVGARFLYIDVECPRRGHYRLTFKPIVPSNPEEENPITREYLRMLETTINRAPQFWLWTHKRWCHKR